MGRPAGPVPLGRPNLRGTTEQFTSRLLGKGVTRTNALESPVIAGFFRGLSVRDVVAALAEAPKHCLEDDFCHLVSYRRFPKEHWGRIRHSNFISVNRSRGPSFAAAA